jgi:hypothetical protein
MSGIIRISRDAFVGIIRNIISSNKTIIDKQVLDPGASVTLFNNTVFFAVALIHGDGDPEVQLIVTVGNDTTTLAGNEMAIAVIANEQLKIEAINTDTANQRSTPSIDIALINIG